MQVFSFSLLKPGIGQSRKKRCYAHVVDEKIQRIGRGRRSENNCPEDRRARRQQDHQYERRF